MSGERGFRTTFEKDGYEILVGRSAKDNDALTFGEAAPDDLWLHAQGHSGSHVVIRNPERLDRLPKPVIEYAALLAARHSKARAARGKVEVHLARARDVRKPRGAPAGTVQLKRFERLRVYPLADAP